MKTLVIIFSTVLLAFLRVSLSWSIELPNPPTGYSWVSDGETGANFLKPDGWFYKKGRQKDTIGYFISKEEISGSGEFSTGFTMNIIPDIYAKTKLHPSEYATQLRQAATQIDKKVKTWDQKIGPLPGYGYQTISDQTPLENLVIFNFLIANDSTDTLYLIVFEAPETSWVSAWTIARPMIEMLGIETDI